MAGGKSTRMKEDKSSLEFHGVNQIEFCFDLLNPHCKKIFISNRKEQTLMRSQKGRRQIHDHVEYEGIGPLGGILSAMDEHPNVAWLVLACDLPFVDQDTIEYLIKHRNIKKIATAFKSSYDDLPEPLCTIYENHGKKQILERLKNDIKCPRKILIESDVELIEPNEKHALDNINTPEEYETALKALRKND